MRFLQSNWVLLLSICFVALVSYSANTLSHEFPKWLFVAGSFIVLTIGRYIVSAMLGQRLSIDDHVLDVNGVKYAVLNNADYTHIIDVKIFFELYENNDPDFRLDSLTLLRAENIAISSISAVVGQSKKYVVYVALPEKIIEIWQEKRKSSRNVFLRLAVTSVHYLTGYRAIRTQDFVL